MVGRAPCVNDFFGGMLGMVVSRHSIRVCCGAYEAVSMNSYLLYAMGKIPAVRAMAGTMHAKLC